MHSDWLGREKGLLALNLADGPMIVGFNGRIFDTGVDHGGIDHLVAQEFLDAGNLHPGVEQARGTGVPQAMWI